jgi:hypothetical protein
VSEDTPPDEVRRRMVKVLGQRIRKALDYAVRYGGIDGEHHKTWTIDQMVRALTGCPERDGVQGECGEYRRLVADAKAGEDGPDTYSWDVGIAP